MASIERTLRRRNKREAARRELETETKESRRRARDLGLLAPREKAPIQIGNRVPPVSLAHPFLLEPDGTPKMVRNPIFKFKKVGRNPKERAENQREVYLKLPGGTLVTVAKYASVGVVECSAEVGAIRKRPCGEPAHHAFGLCPKHLEDR